MMYLFLSQNSFKHELSCKPSFAVNYHGQDGLHPASHLLVLITGEIREFSCEPCKSLEQESVASESMELYYRLVFLTL